MVLWASSRGSPSLNGASGVLMPHLMMGSRSWQVVSRVVLQAFQGHEFNLSTAYVSTSQSIV